MTLEEARSALETAKLSARVDGNEAAIRNLLDWAEGIQTILEGMAEAEGDDGK